jgi:hypothetical protein
MTASLFDAETLASEWTERICQRLREIGVGVDELRETQIIIHTFTKTAVIELSRDRVVKLPYSPDPMIIEVEQAHQIIDLFLRGVNQVSKNLRNSGKTWSERKVILEAVAWKIFNLAKLLVAFLTVPNPELASVLKNSRDLQLMMKQSVGNLLEETEREMSKRK